MNTISNLVVLQSELKNICIDNYADWTHYKQIEDETKIQADKAFERILYYAKRAV
jgi:hypothetical protein